jgi:hypothetical protein
LGLAFALLLLVAAGVAFHALRSRRRRAERRAEVFDDLLTLDVSGRAFDAPALDGLPDRAAAWLRNALVPGQPVSLTVDVRFAGYLRAPGENEWLPFRARERVAAGKGFIWEGRLAALGPFFLSGAEWFRDGRHESHFELQGLFPVVREHGDADVRAPRARFLLEHLWLPAALLPASGAAWSETGVGLAAVVPAGWDVPLGLGIEPGGVLRSASVLRFRPDTGRMANFGLSIEREGDFDGHRLPARFTGGWNFGTDDYVETVRVTVESVRYF